MSGSLIVIAGPTASGKTALAVEISRACGGEVISADSMQVYRHFDIGSGKPTEAEREGIPHHLIDIADPDEGFSAARFVDLADAAIAEIRGRGRRPVVAGGTGLYLRALLHGLFEAPPPDPEIRAEHCRLRREHGLEPLWLELQRVDPEAAARIDRHDFVRISRALEVQQQTGVPISRWQAGHRFAGSRHRAQVVGLRPSREDLRRLIERRVDRMLEAGWLEEVRGLIERGWGESRPMGALGYRHLRAHLRRELDLDEAVRQTKRDTWRFAKRQLNWFRGDAEIRWYEQASAVTLREFDDLER